MGAAEALSLSTCRWRWACDDLPPMAIPGSDGADMAGARGPLPLPGRELQRLLAARALVHTRLGRIVALCHRASTLKTRFTNIFCPSSISEASMRPNPRYTSVDGFAWSHEPGGVSDGATYMVVLG
jgi:hypothetical protein